MNLTVNDYKTYSKQFSSIEIEIIPAKDKFGIFINIKEKQEYYHIYFNDNKEEIKKNEFNQEDKVSKINIIIDYHILSLEELFSNCKCIESITFKKFYRNNISNMRRMFDNCISLQNLGSFKF